MQKSLQKNLNWKVICNFKKKKVPCKKNKFRRIKSFAKKKGVICKLSQRCIQLKTTCKNKRNHKWDLIYISTLRLKGHEMIAVTSLVSSRVSQEIWDDNKLEISDISHQMIWASPHLFNTWMRPIDSFMSVYFYSRNFRKHLRQSWSFSDS